MKHISANIAQETRHTQPFHSHLHAYRSKWRLYDPAGSKFVDEGDMRIVAEKGGDDTSLRFTVKGHKVKQRDKVWLLLYFSEAWQQARVSGILWHDKIGIITVSWDKFIKTWSAGLC